MEFKSVSKETAILDPRRDMALTTIPSEIRYDPLTGRSARICHFMDLKWPSPDFEAMVAGTQEYCPFCPEKVMTVTPAFPHDLLPEGRLKDGERVLLPNIAPYDGISAVAVMGARHFVPMEDITPGFIEGSLALCHRFFERVHQSGHPGSLYHIVNWNYMPPSGSSLIHTHLQVFVTDSAPNLLRQELAAARQYRSGQGSNYWQDLVAGEEKEGSRFLGRIGRSVWLVPYAPMGVAGDVLAVVLGASSALDLSGQDLADLAQGLSRAVVAYRPTGIYSFNMNYFPAAPGEESSCFHLLFSPRTFFNQALGTPDVGALRNLFNETLCMAFPEEIAQSLRPHFQ